MTLSTWFAGWKVKGESDHRALIRLSAASTVSVNTIKMALAGGALGAKTAQRLAAVTDGKVHPWDLCAPAAAADGA